MTTERDTLNAFLAAWAEYFEYDPKQSKRRADLWEQVWQAWDAYIEDEEPADPEDALERTIIATLMMTGDDAGLGEIFGKMMPLVSDPVADFVYEFLTGEKYVANEGMAA